MNDTPVKILERFRVKSENLPFAFNPFRQGAKLPSPDTPKHIAQTVVITDFHMFVMTGILPGLCGQITRPLNERPVR